MSGATKSANVALEPAACPLTVSVDRGKYLMSRQAESSAMHAGPVKLALRT